MCKLMGADSIGLQFPRGVKLHLFEVVGGKAYLLAGWRPCGCIQCIRLYTMGYFGTLEFKLKRNFRHSDNESFVLDLKNVCPLTILCTEKILEKPKQTLGKLKISKLPLILRKHFGREMEAPGSLDQCDL